MKLKKVKLKDLSHNVGQVEGLPKNPRIIKNERFKKLLNSLKEDPEMLELRELIAYDNGGKLVVIMGNMRLKGLRELGEESTFVKILPEDTPVEKLKRYVIKDNVEFGEDSWEDLESDWGGEPLEEWGVESDRKKKKDEVEGEVEFSEYLGEANNYVVLFFDNEIDWLQAQTHFNLKTVASKRSNGKPWSKGIGRVINGSEYLKNII